MHLRSGRIHLAGDIYFSFYPKIGLINDHVELTYQMDLQVNIIKTWVGKISYLGD